MIGKYESSDKNSEHISSRFLEFVEENDMTQFIHCPTHYRTTQTSSLIDLVLSNDSHLVNNITHFPPLGLSHRSVLTFDIDLSPPTVVIVPVAKFQIDKGGDYVSMRNYKSKAEWDTELLGTNVDCFLKVIV